MTILRVFEESLEKKTSGKKGRIKESTVSLFKAAISIFKLWMKETQRPDFGVVQSHPYKITKRKMESFYDWDLDRVSEATANNHIAILHCLMEKIILLPLRMSRIGNLLQLQKIIYLLLMRREISSI